MSRLIEVLQSEVVAQNIAVSNEDFEHRMSHPDYSDHSDHSDSGGWGDGWSDGPNHGDSWSDAGWPYKTVK